MVRPDNLTQDWGRDSPGRQHATHVRSIGSPAGDQGSINRSPAGDPSLTNRVPIGKIIHSLLTLVAPSFESRSHCLLFRIDQSYR
ncbi:hypothetical protein F2Q68_00030903 [Brassica cretica]|uniref:Uncharacterized protein n=2 Tax=Brassica cretica TaxID=69181 RepID=A0ABQ7B7T8_BRACR|nr:hypothetical protein F2Q68_00030903 [Brassica cretica]KAF3528240.1 hypothetical protein DY000_02039669 [Brassica cretica]